MAHWKQYRLNVAVKIYSKKNNELAVKMLPKEVEMLQKLKHPNVVTFFGAWETKYRVYLVMELVGNGNLLHYLTEHDNVDEDQAKTWFSQLCSAVKYCHDMEIAHR
jgi:serine/threonine protein kinase